MKYGKVQREILLIYGRNELDYYNTLNDRDRMAYCRYCNNHEEVQPPTIWYETIRKKTNKMELYVEQLFGENGLREYRSMQVNDRHNYYVYLYRKKSGIDELLTPYQWRRIRDENRENMDFTEIARKLELDDETVRKAYSSAMQKIKFYIIRNPKFKYLIEYLY